MLTYAVNGVVMEYRDVMLRLRHSDFVYGRGGREDSYKRLKT